MNMVDQDLLERLRRQNSEQAAQIEDLQKRIYEIESKYIKLMSKLEFVVFEYKQ